MVIYRNYITFDIVKQSNDLRKMDIPNNIVVIVLFVDFGFLFSGILRFFVLSYAMN